jgi:TolA-binding protein
MLTQKDSWLNRMAQQNTAKIQAVNAQKSIDALNDRIEKMELKKANLKKSDNKKQLQNLTKQIKSLEKTKRGWVAKLATVQESTGELNVQQVVEEAYLRTLSRFPTEEELARCEQHIEEEEDLVKGVTGVLWALVNTKEFIVNH